MNKISHTLVKIENKNNSTIHQKTDKLKTIIVVSINSCGKPRPGVNYKFIILLNVVSKSNFAVF